MIHDEIFPTNNYILPARCLAVGWLADHLIKFLIVFLICEVGLYIFQQVPLNKTRDFPVIASIHNYHRIFLSASRITDCSYFQRCDKANRDK